MLLPQTDQLAVTSIISSSVHSSAQLPGEYTPTCMPQCATGNLLVSIIACISPGSYSWPNRATIVIIRHTCGTFFDETMAYTGFEPTICGWASDVLTIWPLQPNIWILVSLCDLEPEMVLKLKSSTPMKWQQYKRHMFYCWSHFP